MTKLLVCLFLLCHFSSLALADDFYEMLGVARNANEREIRKGFKKKALTLHPDKNTDDPDAHEKFVRLNRAYEVLKDEDLRKKYDMYGEEGLDENRSSGNQYHSWSYYHDNFGIYDDDPEVVTLNKADFEQSVTGSEDIWFINFYHPMCSHCHTLAPVWREVARDLEGVVRIGAVNCDDEYHLCSSQGIRSYPTLVSYPGRIFYRQEKSKESLIDFMLKQVQSSVITLQKSNLESILEYEDYKSRPWLVIFYEDTDEVDDLWITQKKLSAIFDGIVNFGRVECFQQKSLCSSLGMKSGLKFFEVDQIRKGQGTVIPSLNVQEIAKEVLALLPEMKKLDEETFKNIRRNLEMREETVAWLMHFSSDSDDDTFEIRKLPGLLPSLKMGQVDCSLLKKLCDDLYIAKTPTFMIFKPSGGYELHHGRLLAHDIAVFAREGAAATRFQILTPEEFPKVLTDGSTWFVDFYAPWCPPCMKLLPEFRKASRLVETPVKFGSIDCTTHQSLCTRFNIHQYPTTILYNQSVPHEYSGYHTADQIVEFVKDTLNPAVISLDEDKFDNLIENKPQGELWVVDYFAHWCGHCKEMAPEYRRFARIMADVPNVHIATIDCANFRSSCSRQGITSYPSIVLYPSESVGTRRAEKYNGWSRDADSFRQWVYSRMSSVVTVLNDRSYEQILNNREPWLVDFYAPWCGHCHVFAPDFEDIARALQGTVKAGKIDCERYRWVCSGAGVNAYPTVKLYVGSPNGGRQNVNGINFPNLNKQTILSNIPRYLPKNSKNHDEL
ncbi:dnaJ homolog subfamily C member 10-like [Penaeus chinensis]|uniref:dnaJ homolog subfamily C member 10-like n=1 Tax=Penaeus chinensis TaxID=139456 RepID=UPI001FB7BC83|nr:dnaJ homolog subfamily C member 10-like [Penaeus chinensis]